MSSSNPKTSNAEIDNESGSAVSNATYAQYEAYKKTDAYKNSKEGKRIAAAKLEIAAKKALHKKGGWENAKKKMDKIVKTSPNKSGIPASPTH
jgi:hypothetical protein